MELVAPARDLDTLNAAFDAGADAVYLGLQDFSARKRAKNFTFVDLIQALSVRNTLRKKVYVALNTLIFEEEFGNLIEILSFLESVKVDAVIIQDYGVYSLIKEFSIALPIHASTQMGTKNYLHANFLKKLGFKRVVLERQLTLSEIEAIRRKTDIELEVFVHGSMCFSLSGSCFFSKAFSDRSGNRGDCVQPCRWCFLSEKKRDFFPFSMKDLEGLSVLPQLSKAKIESVKIEGRMKGVDYVYPVVSAYRKAIDIIKKGDVTKDLLNEIQQQLSNSTLSRPSAKGFFFFPHTSLIDNNETSTGILIGKIASCTKNSFFFKTSKTVNVGDTLRIDDRDKDKRFKVPVKAIYLNGQKIKTAGANDYIGMPTPFPNINNGALVFLVHKRNNYNIKKISSLSTDIVPDYKDKCLELKEAYAQYKNRFKLHKPIIEQLNFVSDKICYDLKHFGKYYFSSPFSFESELNIYKHKISKTFSGALVSYPYEAEIFNNFSTIGNFFLYATNIFAIIFFQSLNIDGFSVPKDMPNKSFQNIKPYAKLWINWQNIPLCITRTTIPDEIYTMKSLKNKKIYIKDGKAGKYLFLANI